MLRSLYSKLALTLFIMVSLVGFVFLQMVSYASGLYQQEVAQKLNRGLADNIVAEDLIIKDGRVNHTALEKIFHMLMVINPSIELYLLDTEGRILTYSAPEEVVKRSHVSLVPIQQFLEGKNAFPLRGDDPRNPQRKKVFSVAEITAEDRLQAYMYIILGGEKFEGVAQMLRDSYSLRFAIWWLGAALLLAFMAGLVIFFLLTQRLRKLATAVVGFSVSEHKSADLSGNLLVEGTGQGDEIEQLAVSFKQMLGKISEQILQLEKMDSQRRDLIANVSHDLRTPVTNLQGYLETLSLKDDSLSESEKSQYLEIALSQSQRLGKLINELFELAKLDACENIIYAEPFSIADIAQDMQQKFQLKARERQINLTVEAGKDVPLVYGDIGLIHRVLENLLENAIRHTPKNGKVTIGFVAAGGRLVVRVADTGCGIPEKAIAHVFDRFYRADASRTNGLENAGLGLAIARRILELHGSRIKVRSKRNSGTVFSFDMPVWQA